LNWSIREGRDIAKEAAQVSAFNLGWLHSGFVIDCGGTATKDVPGRKSPGQD
jgi:hypothetical protein